MPPAVNNKKHAGTAEGILYWEFLKQACKSVPYNCIDKISQIDDVRTSRGKVGTFYSSFFKNLD